MFPPVAEWRPPDLSSLPDWSRASRIGVDTETCDPQLEELGIGVRRDGRLVGVSVKIEDGPGFYLPMRHAGGDNLDPARVLAYLRDNARRFRGTVVGANLDYDLDYLWEEDVRFAPEVTYADVQVADPLIYELHASYKLDAIAERWGIPGKDEEMLLRAAHDYNVHPKRELWKLPARYVGAYAEADADRPLRILRRQERKIEEEDLWRIWKLECDVLPVLLRMRRRGVRIDFDKLDEIERWARAGELEALRIATHHTGIQLNPSDTTKTEALARALEAIGVKLALTSQGQPNIDRFLLSGLDHPVATAISRAKKLNKMRTTFCASMRRYATHGRIHCTFNQIVREDEDGQIKGARPGRLSATHPNLQQQPSPKRDPEIAGEWRKIFLPEEGASWGGADYSKQEPRWLTHFAASCSPPLPGAMDMVQRYRENPRFDTYARLAELTGQPYAWNKNIYLGIGYGEGGAKLCRTLGLPTRWAVRFDRSEVRYFEHQEQARRAAGESSLSTFVWQAAGEEGQRILDDFDEQVPFVRLLSKKATKAATARGYVKTLLGRKLHFPQRGDGRYDWGHKGLNRVVQGTAAEQMKQALVDLDRAGHWIMLQVHDEEGSSVHSEREIREQCEIMENALQGKVPFYASPEMGENWGALKPVA